MRALLAALALAAQPLNAQMYKCVDERGAAHYTDKPRAGCREVDIRGQPPISGTVAPRREDWSREEHEFQRRRIEEERRAEAEARSREARERRCTAMRARLAQLEQAGRVAVFDSKGERRYMDDGERETLLAKLRGEIARECP